MPSNMGYLYPVYPIINGVVIVLTAIPIPIHWKAGNVATTAVGLWILGLEIICWFGTVVWHNNIRNDYPVWGDIVSFYQTAWPSAVAACNFCIQYRLWTIARARTVFITKRDKRRQLYSTLAMCVGLPIFVALLHYIVQGHRYNVLEDLGPTFTTYNVTLAYPLYYLVDPVIVLITAVFSGMTIRLLLARRKELDAILNYGSSNINRSKYVRLLCLAGASISLHLPFSFWVIGQEITLGVRPWISWEVTQFDWTRITYYPRKTMELFPYMIASYSTYVWSVTFTGFVYFAFFGFGEEAMSYYRKLIGLVLWPFGIQYPKPRRRSAVERTWLDVLLGRPGKPRRFSFSTGSWTAQPPTTGNSTFRMARRGHAASGVTTSTVVQHGAEIDEAYRLDMTNVDLTNLPRPQNQVGTRTEAPDKDIADKRSLTDRLSPWRHSVGPRINIPTDIANSGLTTEESTDIADEKRDLGPEPLPRTESDGADGDVDLEAQELAGEAARREQERIRLELHPELTCQITF